MKNVIGVAMIGVAIYAYIPLVPKNIVPEFTTPDAPVPTGQVKEKVMDLKDEIKRLEKNLSRNRSDLSSFESKLGNEKFIKQN